MTGDPEVPVLTHPLFAGNGLGEPRNDQKLAAGLEPLRQSPQRDHRFKKALLHVRQHDGVLRRR
jgi:hypothetical protein